ncbi:MAG: bile acid:sodium symporter [Nitrospira sp.]|jgi:BASS family bile acid:Na+ symporter|nr:bile acid:sodium symporter [Nitrospira sp. BO4]
MEARKFTFLGLSQLVHHHLLWFLLGVYALAAVYPRPGLAIRQISFGTLSFSGTGTPISVLLVLLAILMFNAGLGLKAAHLKALFDHKWLLMTGLVANVLIPIAYIFGITLVLQLWHNPEEAQHILVGLALVAAMPIAGASSTWTQNSNGNLALSLGLILFSTLLSPIITPWAFYVFGEMASEEYETVIHNVSTYGSGGFLGLWVVLPSLLGLSIRMTASEVSLAAIMPYIKLVNSAVLLLLNYSNASVSLPQAVSEHDWDFLAVTFAITTGLCLTAFAVGYWLSGRFGLEESETVALMYGLGMNNNGTGLVLASLVLAAYPRVMVPIIFYNLVQHVVAGSIHIALDRKRRAQEDG